MVPRIDHIGIATPSIAEARKLYEALGLSVTAIEEVPEEGVRVAMIPCGDTQIELLEPLAPADPNASAVARFLTQRGPGIHHVCLASDDVRADTERLRAQGYTVLRPAPTRGAGGCWVNFVHPKSTGGILLELSEPPSSDEH
jgi:methylmalonyl-CoA/ethylmalonyl-CoA epimerase